MDNTLTTNGSLQVVHYKWFGASTNAAFLSLKISMHTADAIATWQACSSDVSPVQDRVRQQCPIRQQLIKFQ